LVEENKNKVLKKAASDFTKKVSILKSVLEIAITGSVAGGDRYPSDLDISFVVDNLDELVQISKYARQMSRYYHSWEVFLFDKKLIIPFSGSRTGRAHYQEIVDYLKQMKKIKGFEKELMELASSLKEKYKNRPTFLDEMQRI